MYQTQHAQLTAMAFQYLEELRKGQSDHFIELEGVDGKLYQVNKDGDLNGLLRIKMKAIRDSKGVTIPIPFFNGQRLICFTFDQVI